jgi:hypothetical protein
MKYYVYVSDSKVDMFYAQIPANLREKIATELKIDLKVISATFKSDANESTKFSKLKLVTEYIERHEVVGTVDKPENYFKGTMNMRWGPVGGRNDTIMYFGGVTDETVLGLAGSIHNVIGAPGTSDLIGALGWVPGSATPRILSALRAVIDVGDGRKTDEFSLHSIAYATRYMHGPLQKFEFLAKRLQEEKKGRGLSILLGSPFFVALAE